MGYTTTFDGELLFADELIASQLAALKSMCGEDCREHPEWSVTSLTYIDLELNTDFTGLQWDGSEKTYDLVEKVNLVLTQMRKRWPNFSLKGQLKAQGEDFQDRWLLTIGTNGFAQRVDVALKDRIVCCS